MVDDDDDEGRKQARIRSDSRTFRIQSLGVEKY